MGLHQWSFHLGRLLLGTLACLILGWLIGQPLWTVVLALVLYTGWHLYNAVRLIHWFNRPSDDLPEGHGIWAEIHYGIANMQKTNLREKRQLQATIVEFQRATNAFPDATIIINRDLNILWFNQAAAQLGLRLPEDQGQIITNLIRGQAFSNWLAIHDKLQSSVDIAAPGDDNRVLSVNGVTYQDDQCLLIFRDVTRVRRLERVRRDFVANVSHELRTPLTVIMGYLDMLHNDCPEEMVSALQRMLQQGQQMQHLLADLLELSRIQDDVIDDSEQPISVPGMLSQLQEQAIELSQERHQLRFNVQQGLHMMGLERDLESAFRNLITNAIHYTPANGTIQVSWQETDDWLEFFVRDTGIGIPTRDIPRITERFYRVGSDRARSNGGSGLGLAIVKHVVHSHQGKLEITSTLGEGSTFTCRFPKSRRINELNQRPASGAA